MWKNYLLDFPTLLKFEYGRYLVFVNLTTMFRARHKKHVVYTLGLFLPYYTEEVQLGRSRVLLLLYM